MRWVRNNAVIGIAVLSLLWHAALPVEAAPQRIALVIGNADYTRISALANPKNDAALISRTLREVGFNVISTTNANRRAMARAIRNFGQRLSSAGQDAVGLFYYAGHGVQAGGTNYLIPLEAEITLVADLEGEAISASWVLRQMEEAGNGLNVIILDACRNNPFKPPPNSSSRAFRNASRGLARMNPPSGSLLSYAAAPGQVAADGKGRNSPYTRALAKTMKRPGLKLEDVFKRVRNDVERVTKRRQTPWEESSLRGDFYFVPPKPERQAPSASRQQTQPGSTSSNRSYEALFWDTIQDSDDPSDFRAYLERFPNGIFVVLAKNRLKRLKNRKVASTQPRTTRPQKRVEPPTQRIDPKIVEANLALSRSERILVQKGLRALKYTRSSADGLFGSATRSAIRLYQVRTGNRSTGYLTADQAKTLIAKGRERQVAVGTFPQRPPVTTKPASRYTPGKGFRDCNGCPRMVVIPSGSFYMGSPSYEKHRRSTEGPRHRVTIRRPFAIGSFEVTRGQFDKFVKESNRKIARGCYIYRGSKWVKDMSLNWRNPGFKQTNFHPVVCISWWDAKAYVRWLSKKTNKRYRLPTEAEWEYAARARSTTPFHTGTKISTRQANFRGTPENYTGNVRGVHRGRTTFVGTFRPNALGLYDVHGNVSEMTEDCYHANYSGAPTDGRAWTINAKCSLRVRRGGNRNYWARHIRSASRYKLGTTVRIDTIGFRVAMTLDSDSPGGAGAGIR